MTVSGLLDAAVDVINRLGLMPVITATAVIGIAFYLYYRFFSNRG